MRTIALFLILLGTYTASAMTKKFCTNVHELDFNPFRQIRDDSHFSYYLAVLKPYLDTDEGKNGILKSISFSKDGSVLRATISENAKWQDGTNISPLEAIYGIVKGFKFRDISTYVEVGGVDKDSSFDDILKNENIRITGSKSFTIKFKYNVADGSNIVRKALSSGSSDYKVWPIRKDSTDFDVVSKYPIEKSKNEYFIKPFSTKIKLATIDDCENSDFYTLESSFHRFSKNRDDYIEFLSPNFQTLIGFFNKERIISSDDRKSIVSFMRGSVLPLNDKPNYKLTAGHFDHGERGHICGLCWCIKEKLLPNHIKKISILTFDTSMRNSIWAKQLEEDAAMSGSKIEWLEPDIETDPLGKGKADILLVSHQVLDSGQIWMQSIMHEEDYKYFLKPFDKTYRYLEYLTESSASLNRSNHDDVVSFEFANHEETAIMPFFRYKLSTYSNKNLNFSLKYINSKEMVFSQ